MKISAFSALASAIALAAFHTSATPLPSPIVGPITFNWTLTTANLVDSPKYPAPGKTTVIGSGSSKTTDILQVYTSSEETIPRFANSSLISLLSNSFNMAFPPGTKLVTSGDVIFLVDSTETNQIVDISSVLSVSSLNEISSGVDTVNTAVKSGSTNTSTVKIHFGNEFIIVTYDDSGRQTLDGTTTTFQFAGISASSSKSTSTESTNFVLKASTTSVMHGSGFGTLRGKNYLIQGTITGGTSGTENIAIP